MGEVLNNRILSLFYSKFLTKDVKDYYGMKYTSLMGQDGRIQINFTNPENLSFNPEVLKGQKEEFVLDFLKLIGFIRGWEEPLFKELLNRIDILYDGKKINNRVVYLNSSDTQLLNILSKSIVVYDIEGFYSPCSVTFENAYIEAEDHIQLNLNVKLLNPTYKNDKHLSDDELKDAIQEVIESDNGYDYSMIFADSLVGFFWNNPLLMDTDYMFITSSLDFFDKNGEKIKWWEGGY